MPELILNADDYGYSPAVNRVVECLAVAGRITSFTLMANLEGAADVGKVAAKLEEKCSIGLHVNLTEGRPIVETSLVSSLVQANGEFFPPPTFVRRLLTGRIRFRDLRAEILAQIRTIQMWLGRFSHFDSHHHVHRFPPVTKAIVSAAAETCAPKRIRTNRRYLASGRQPRASNFELWWRHFRTHPRALPGLYFKARQEHLFRLHHFSSPDHLLTVVPPIRPLPVASAAECWTRVFQSLPEACYELNWHPGRVDGEDALLCSPGFDQALEAVRLVSYDAMR